MILIFQFANAQNWRWETFTSMHSIRSVTIADSTIWAATEGGIISFDLNTQAIEKWTNTEGLSDNDATALANENNLAIWIGFNNGAIQKYDLQKNSFLSINEYLGQPIQCLHIHGDSLFVGLDIGLSLYLISKNEVKETYKRLGVDLQVELPVNDILTVEDTLWVATDEGIAKGALGTKNLLDPTNWQNITDAAILPSKEVKHLHFYNNSIFVGTSNGLVEFDKQNRIEHLSYKILDIDDDSKQLFTFVERSEDTNNDGYDETFYEIYQYDTAWNLFCNCFNANIIYFENDIKVLGSDNGLYLLDSQHNWQSVPLNCMSSNRISTMTVDHNGVLYVGSGSSKSGGTGYSVYSNGNWVNYDRSDIDLINNNDFLESTVDQHNNVWLGTWGDGLLVIKNDSTMIHYDETNGVLSSSDAGDPNYPAVTGIVEDLNGVIWVTIWDSQLNQQLVAITDSLVTHFGPSDQLYANDLISITVDTWNRKWIGSASNGIYVLDDNYTPHDKSDDQMASVTDSDGLDSENIAALAADQEGGVYIGTPNGLQYFLSSLSDIQYGLFSNNIKALALDGVGNIWAGTQGGISYYHDGLWNNFSVDNSLLVDNDILSLAVDKQNGYIYAGTTKGISRITTSFIEPEASLTELTIFPNPFIPDQHEAVQIDGLISRVCLTIFTSSGYLVKKISMLDDVNGRRVSWDGTDTMEQPVPAGIYIAVMSNEDGSKKQLGKIALIR